MTNLHWIARLLAKHANCVVGKIHCPKRLSCPRMYLHLSRRVYSALASSPASSRPTRTDDRGGKLFRAASASTRRDVQAAPVGRPRDECLWWYAPMGAPMKAWAPYCSMASSNDCRDAGNRPPAPTQRGGADSYYFLFYLPRAMDAPRRCGAAGAYCRVLVGSGPQCMCTGDR